MAISSIESNQAPSPVGPYSPAVRAGDFLFISGQIPLTTSGDIITGDIQAETRQVLSNIDALLRAANLTFANVVKMALFTTDITQFDAINAVYSDYITTRPFPARSMVEVSALPRGVRIEMEAICFVK